MNWNTFVENWKSFSLVRKIVLCVVGVVAAVVLLLVVAFIKASFGYSFGSSQGGMIPSTTLTVSAPMMPVTGGVSSMSYGKVSFDTYRGDGSSPVMYEQATPTADAELYEVTSYQATVESRTMEDDCKAIQALKSDDAIIFLSSSVGKTSCSFNFKAKKSASKKALDAINALNPKQLTENVNTIEDTLITYDRRKEILENKLKTIDSILTEAVASYQEVSRLAVQTGSVTNLRQAINDKVDIVERLTQKKLAIEQELASISNSNTSDLEQTNYSQFSVYITKDTFIDKDSLVSSWKSEIKRLVREINSSLQAITIGFLSVALTLITYILYLLVGVVILKYLKKGIVSIWNK